MLLTLKSIAQQKNLFAKIAVADEVALSGAVLNASSKKIKDEVFFYGKALSQGNKLFWKSNKESNIDAFVLKRSLNDDDFSIVYEIAALGNDSTGAFYAFEDQHFNMHKCFYKLSSINNNAIINDSQKIYLDRKQAVFDKINIEFDFVSKNFNLNLTPDFGTQARLLIYNIVGDIIYKHNYFLLVGSNNISFNLSDFPFGTYFLKMYFDGNTFTKKIVKED